ncbi:MAG: cytidylate kinase [Rickettsiales bacterium TMED251]|nr:MAG: cytidylate kinase [Rickettsiales bacterium TMED251]
MKTKKPMITIDGPAASGKGTISEKLANELDFYHLETGIFYRSLAAEYMKEKYQKKNLNFFLKNVNSNCFSSDLDRSCIYTEKVTEIASVLAKKKIIRKYIISIQKKFIKKYSAHFKGIILDGRDCGTVIAPRADVKIYLTANLKVRAERRFQQIEKGKNNIDYKKILNELSARDDRDKNRKNSPLKMAEDAFLVDNSEIDLLATISIVKKIIFSKLPYLKKK